MIEYQRRLGPANGRTKLSGVRVRKIRILLADGVPRTQIAKQFDVSKSTIQQIAERKAWAWVE